MSKDYIKEKNHVIFKPTSSGIKKGPLKLVIVGKEVGKSIFNGTKTTTKDRD